MTNASQQHKEPDTPPTPAQVRAAHAMLCDVLNEGAAYRVRRRGKQIRFERVRVDDAKSV